MNITSAHSWKGYIHFSSALRTLGLGVRLKAVLTPTNVGWNACQLYAELCREREAFRRGDCSGRKS